MSRLILDADGVFLDERPYWNAALATAFAVNGLRSRIGGQWDRFTNVAFGQLGMQRLTKNRGCNSNWDLAVVLTKALQGLSVQQRVAEDLMANRGEYALQTLSRAADSLWNEDHANRPAANGPERRCDPLLGFGVDRRSPEFTRVRAMFQQMLRDGSQLGHSTAEARLLEPLETTRRTFTECRACGFELWVCTGRDRCEIVAPLVEFGLEADLAADRIVSGDEVAAAEQRTGIEFLGKPHWFPPACAARGLDGAVALLKKMPGASLPDRCVYVGDALADFQSVLGCRGIGLQMEYVHVRSGVTTEADERLIASTAGTRAVIDRLSDLPVFLGPH
jgi:phosphoglycolate phosphatase-like HAD superfamily hydrolase